MSVIVGVSELLTQLQQANISLSLVNGELSVKAPAGAMTQPLMSALKSHKAALLKLLRQREGGNELTHVDKNSVLATRTQYGLWLAEQASNNSAVAYVMPAAIRLEGVLDIAAMTQALSGITRRYPLLLSRFEHHDEQLRLIRNSADFVGDALQNVTPSEVDEQVAEYFATPFDLATGPLFKAKLLKLAPQQHILLLAVHHLVADGQSVNTLKQQISQLYNGYLRQQSTSLQEDSISFENYADWAHKQPQTDKINYWLEQLQGAPQQLRLPLARHIAPAQQNQDQQTLLLSESQTTAIRQLAIRLQCTPNMVMLAAFQLLLGRLSGSEDVVIGTPGVNRPFKSLAQSVGLFLDVLPIRTRWQADDRCEDLIDAVKQQMIGAFGHEGVAFHDLVTGLKCARAEHHPVFQCFFNFLSQGQTPWAFDALTVTPLAVTAALSKFDLTLYVHDQPQFELQAHFDKRQYTAATVAVWLQQYKQLLTQFCHNSDERLGQLSLADEPAVPLAQYCSLATDLPMRPEQRLSQWAKQTPDAVAVISGDDSFSYAQLQLDVDTMAAQLAAQLTDPLKPVAIIADKHYQLIVMMYASLTLAVPFVIVNANYPRSRIKHIISAAGAELAVDLTGECAVSVADCRCLSLAALATHSARAELPSKINAHSIKGQPDGLAYLGVTSASTGQAKLVKGQLDSIGYYSRWVSEVLEVEPGTRCGMLSNVGHDPMLRDVFGCLSNGGQLVIPQLELTAANLALWLAKYHIEVVGLAPALGQILALNTTLDASSTLRKVWFIGEKLRCATVEQLQQLLPQTAFFNLYGATETQQMLSVFAITAEALTAYSVVPVGQAMPGGRCVVLNRGHQLDVGEMGEIVFVSQLLSPGYLIEASQSSGFFSYQGLPAYKTGDQGYFDHSGQLHIVGRADRQCQIRGYRVEPDAIEQVISRLPEVTEVAVKVVDGDEPQLLAYVCLAEAAAPDRALIIKHCQAQLPDYMTPALIGFLPQLPRNSHGKVDYAGLPTLQVEAISVVAPTNELEQQLQQIWQQALNQDSVCCQQSLFAQGGHSLTAAKIVSLIERQLHKALPLPQLFAHPSIRELAVYLQSAQAVADITVTELLVDQANRAEPFAMTTIQKGFDAARKAHVGEQAVGGTGFVEIDVSTLDLDRLTAAINLTIRKHDMLRAVINDQQQQYILPEVAAYQPQLLDWQDADNASISEQLKQHRQQMNNQSFDCRQWPSFELRYVKLPEQQQRLLIAVDILFIDYPSGQLLRDDLLHFYHQGEAAMQQLPLSFRDIIVHHNNPLSSAATEQARTYWLARISEMPLAPRLALADLPQNAWQYHDQTHKYQLPQAQWQRLKSLAVQFACTPTALLLEGFCQVIQRWSEHSAFSLNMVVNERPAWHPAVTELVGNFSSTILYAHQPEAGQALASRFGWCQKALVEALSHKAFDGLEVLQALTRFHGSALSMPIIFNSQLVHTSVSDDPQVALPVLDNHVENGAHIWLESIVCEVGDSLEIRWLAKDQLFAGQTLNQMFDAYCQLLNDIAADDFDCRRHLELALPAPQQQRRLQVNATEQNLPSGLLHQAVIERALQQPAAIAVVQGDTRLSYASLLYQADQLAQQLRQFRVANNELVAVHMEKSWQQVVAVLAINLAGAAYLPIDAGQPLSRRLQVLEQGKVQVVIGAEVSAELADYTQLTITAVAALPATVAVPEQSPVSETDLAYVIFTSGSTGMPKGVMIRHSAARNTVEDINQRFAVGPTDAMLGLSSLSFDLSVYDVFGVLSAGGKLVLPAPQQSRDPAAWQQLIEHEQISLWNSVPALMQMLVDYCGESGVPGLLRCCLLSGDWVGVKMAAQLRAQQPQMQLISLGGATEASIWSIFYPLGVVDSRWSSVPYGKPLANQGYLVLNDLMEDCPDLVKGDLYISGVGLADGYWRDAEKTTASFIFCRQRQMMLYKTGDKGRYLDDGNIEFMGREDGQVKVRGYRIELGEIEYLLGQHDDIAQVIVDVARADSEGDVLVAYLVAGDALIDAAECVKTLKAQCRQQLPAYMQPAIFQWIERLPLSANGKVDRKSLPTPQFEAISIALADEHGDTATVVKALIGRLLHLDAVDDEANFFALGGDSISAVRLCVELRKQSIQLDLTSVFNARTVAGLVHACLPTSQVGSAIEYAPAAIAPELYAELVDSSAYHGGFMVTPMQRGMLLHSQIHAAAYINQARIEISGGFELGKFQHAWSQLCQRHAILASHFIALAEIGIVQLLSKNTQPLVHQHHQFSGMTAVEQDIAALASQCKKFDQGCYGQDLSRFDVIYHPDERVTLLWTFHHALLDGWSLPVLFNDLIQLYEGALMTDAATVGQFSQFVGWLEQQDEVQAGQFWQNYLAGFEQPTRVIHASTNESHADEVVERDELLSRQTSDGLRALAQQTNVTLSTLIRLAWGRVLQLLSSDQAVLFGAVNSGRPVALANIDQMLGLFLVTLPITVRFDGEQSVAELLQSLLQQHEQADHHAWLPLAQIQQNSDIARTGGLFESVVIVENYPLDGIGAGHQQLQIDAIEVQSDTHFELALVVSVAEQLKVNLQYQASLVSDEYAEQIHSLMLNVLTAMAKCTADSPVSALGGVSDADIGVWDHWLQGAGSAAQAEVPQLDVLRQIRHFSEQTPTAIAIECAEQRLSYAQLADQVGQLAVRLQQRKIHRGETVLVCLPPGSELVIAMLAIWQCGAVYVPVDISQPAQRIEKIISQAQPQLAIINAHSRAAVPIVASTLAWLDLAESGSQLSMALTDCQGVAYQLFTSGTTGQPKGVVVEHQALKAFVFAANQVMQGNDTITALSVTTATFDISLLEYLTPLVNGGKLVIAQSHQVQDGQALAKLISEQQINWLQMTPTGWRILLASGWPGVDDLAADFVALSGGEPMTATLGRQLLSACGRVFNCYGPTEATIWSMMGELNLAADGRVLLAGPLSQSGHLVLDQQQQPVPSGGCGELWIAGPSLAWGYLNDPQQTEQRFCTLQNWHGQRIRAYRTGDLVQLKNQHELVFLGRNDAQVKLHGYRIELEEIEQLISEAPAVQAAACKVVNGGTEQAMLVAYLVGEADEAIAQAKAWAQNKLPAYMQPQVWLLIDALPTHVSGKINRGALADPQLADNEYVAPETELQAELQALWQQVFEQTDISIAAGFFALGGNSLIATRLSVLCNQQLAGMTLDIRQLLSGASIAEMAAANEQAWLINKNVSAADDQQMEEMEW